MERLLLIVLAQLVTPATETKLPASQVLAEDACRLPVFNEPIARIIPAAVVSGTVTLDVIAGKVMEYLTGTPEAAIAKVLTHE
jgi:hypothetical protein